MHDTLVTLHDGRTLCGPIWTWRPTEGWFSMIDGETVEVVRLADVASAVTMGQRIGVDLVVNQDELERARNEGWKPT